MKKILFGMVVCALALAGCGSDTFFDEPEPQVYTAENDPALEKLETNVGYYYGDKGVDLTRFEFAYRAAGQYCIFPKPRQEPSNWHNCLNKRDIKYSKSGITFLLPATVTSLPTMTMSVTVIL